MNRFNIELSDEEIREAVLNKIATSLDWKYGVEIKKSVDEYFKTVDQVELNKHITRLLIAKTLGEIK